MPKVQQNIQQNSISTSFHYALIDHRIQKDDTLMTDRKIRKIDDQEDYEKSGYESMMNDVKQTNKQTKKHQNLLDKISREQILSGEETTKELLDGRMENKKKAKKHIRKQKRLLLTSRSSDEAVCYQ